MTAKGEAIAAPAIALTYMSRAGSTSRLDRKHAVTTHRLLIVVTTGFPLSQFPLGQAMLASGFSNLEAYDEHETAVVSEIS
jgi:hypothetical protein